MKYFLKIFFLIIFSFFISLDSIAEVSPFKKENLDQNYLTSRDELKDYILDTGDELNIQFENILELSKYACPVKLSTVDPTNFTCGEPAL